MTSKLTREQLVEKLKHRIAVAEKYPDIEEAQIDSQIFRLALSCLESEPVAWRYRYTKPGVTDSCGEPWVGDWKYVDDSGSCNQDENYERQALYASPQPAPVDISKITEAAEDILLMLDEYPEQLVPVNRGSSVVRSLRAAMLNHIPDATKMTGHSPDAGNKVNSPEIPDGSSVMLRRWLAFGRSMQNAGSQLPRNLIAETEDMLAAAPQEVTSARVHPARDDLAG